jgi:hypothetical protein
LSMRLNHNTGKKKYKKNPGPNLLVGEEID